jgi:general secretion pathway protein A
LKVSTLGLTNYKMDAENRLCLLLLGQTELRRRLAMAVHEALAQRIVVRYHLPALTREEVPSYLAHRLRLAGTELALFEPAAHEALFQATGGLPRKLNLLAHQRRPGEGPRRRVATGRRRSGEV